MKNNLTLYAVLSCALWGLGACQEDTLVQEGANSQVSIIGRMSGEVRTRTCVDTSSPEGVAGILWSPKDVIGVYGEGFDRIKGK